MRAVLVTIILIFASCSYHQEQIPDRVKSVDTTSFSRARLAPRSPEEILRQFENQESQPEPTYDLVKEEVKPIKLSRLLDYRINDSEHLWVLDEPLLPSYIEAIKTVEKHGYKVLICSYKAQVGRVRKLHYWYRKQPGDGLLEALRGDRMKLRGVYRPLNYFTFLGLNGVEDACPVDAPL